MVVAEGKKLYLKYMSSLITFTVTWYAPYLLIFHSPNESQWVFAPPVG